MNGWDDYLSVTVELDTVRRRAANAVASQETAAEHARRDIGVARQRIALQRSRLAEAATRAGRVPLPVEPSPTEVNAASYAVTATAVDPTPGIASAIKGAWTTLDGADAVLSGIADDPSGPGVLRDWPTAARNALPYGWYAMLATIALVIINVVAESPSASFIALAFDFFVPAGAFVLGLISVGLVFGADRNGRVSRSPGLGLAICAVPLVIGVLLSVF